MKMIKATENEIEKAIQLARLTESVCRPKNFESRHFPKESNEVEYFDENDPEDLRKFYERVKMLSCGLMRVTFGYQALVEEVCDPSKAVLDWRPGITAPKT